MALEFPSEDIRFMWKDASSNTGECPGISEVPGGFLVQGPPVGPDTLDRLRDKSHLAVDGSEVAVFVPRNVLDRLRAGG